MSPIDSMRGENLVIVDYSEGPNPGSSSLSSEIHTSKACCSGMECTRSQSGLEKCNTTISSYVDSLLFPKEESSYTTMESPIRKN